MENNFNTPVQVWEANMKAGETKAALSLLKCILLGVIALVAVYVVVNAVTTRVSRAHRIIGELFRINKGD